MSLQLICGCLLVMLALCDRAMARFDNHIVHYQNQNYQNVPKFVVRDEAAARDAELAMRFPYAVYRGYSKYPRYHIIPAILPPSTTMKPKTTTTTTTTEMPTTMSTSDMPSVLASMFDEFPRDLLEIAQEKLGLKSLDEIPSISELGKLLGTNSEAETVQYIRQLTTTEQGIALMKAYIESNDYTDNAGNDADYLTASADEQKANVGDSNGDDDDNNQLANDKFDVGDDGDNDDDDDGADDDDDDDEDVAADGVDDEDAMAELKTMELLRKLQMTTTAPQSTTTTTAASVGKSNGGFFDRMFNYMNIYKLWSPAASTSNAPPAVVVTTEAPPPKPTVVAAQMPPQPMQVKFNRPLPLFVRQPPFHYPIPMRPLTIKRVMPMQAPPPPPPTPLAQPTTTSTQAPPRIDTTTFITTTPTPMSAHVPMNTPKFALSPRIQNLIKSATNISPQKIESLLQLKPKLAQLANRINNFPLSFDRGSQIETQLLAAVQNAIESDEDLRKLLDATETLK